MVISLTVFRSDQALKAIDDALDHWRRLRAASRFEDCSDRPADEVTELIFELARTIEDVAGPSSEEHKAARAAISTSGTNNPYLLTVLPGILKAMRLDVSRGKNFMTPSLSFQPDRKKVFVIHGRNDLARKALFSFLRAVGLEPIEWNEAVSLTGVTAPYIGDILDRAFSLAQSVIVLLTGDDMVRLGTRYNNVHEHSYELTLTPQARPNVLFEAGIAFGRSPDRTILLAVGHSRPFSDIAGRHIIIMSNGIDRRKTLVDRLQMAGCALNISDRTDWMTEGDFDKAALPPDVEGRENA